jgi:hypothetical protein
MKELIKLDLRKRMINVSYIRLTICVAVLLTLLAHPSPASACSCEAGITLPQYFTQYDGVFTGKVTRIVDNYFPIFSTLDTVMYKFGFAPYFFHEDEKRLGYSVFFKVIDAWKGLEKTFVEVNTGRGGGDCGYTFEIGKEYLIYASHAYGIPDNYWVTGICGRTSELAFAAEDLDYLSAFPTLPLKSTLPIMLTEKDVIILGLPFLITVGVLLLIRLRRKNKRQDI